MDSTLTYKEAILIWHQGVTAFDDGNSQQALEVLLQIPEASATSKILYNIGHIYLILKQYAEAAKNFEAAFEKDGHLAVAFYQCGVALYHNDKFNPARKMFEKSKECLRDSQYIDYKALGMAYKLYKCEILFNLSVAVSAMTRDPEWALDILSETDKCEKEPNHVEKITAAKIQLKEGLNPAIFSLPQKELFRPPKDKIENISKKDYLGQSTVVHAVPGSSIKKPARKKEEKIVDLPTPHRKRNSLEPPVRMPPAPNTFKPINMTESSPGTSPTPPNRLPPTSPATHSSSPTPPNRLPPSPTSPATHSSSLTPPNRPPPTDGKPPRPPPSGRPTPSPTPPGRPPPGISNGARPTPSPTPPMRPPPLTSNSGRSSSSSPSPPARVPPQGYERSNSAGKGPPTRPPPISPTILSSTSNSPQQSPVNSRGPSPNKLSHKDTILVWHKAMLVYETGDTPAALDKLLSIPEPTAKILFNIGSMQLLTNDLRNAKKTFEIAVEKDEHMAIGFLQYGIALALQTEYELAWKAFDKARRALRQNDSIDYKQIGLPYKLFECEVLHNQSLMYMYLDDQKLAEEVLELALKKKSELRHSKIDAAMVKLKASSVFDLFTLPKEAMFKPPASKVENISKVDYLGQKKVVAKFEGVAERGIGQLEKELNGRPTRLPPRHSVDLGTTRVYSENEKRRASSPGIRISYHGSFDSPHGSIDEEVYVFKDSMDDNRCYSPPDLDDDFDTYGPVPDISEVRLPSPGPPTRQVPLPPAHPILQKVDSLGPPTRDAPAPPLPLKPGEDLDELYTNFKTNNYNPVTSPTLVSPTDKKPFPSPKPKWWSSDKA